MSDREDDHDPVWVQPHEVTNRYRKIKTKHPSKPLAPEEIRVVGGIDSELVHEKLKEHGAVVFRAREHIDAVAKAAKILAKKNKLHMLVSIESEERVERYELKDKSFIDEDEPVYISCRIVINELVVRLSVKPPKDIYQIGYEPPPAKEKAKKSRKGKKKKVDTDEDEDGSDSSEECG
eukprot:Sspe_Gene.5451::Locus_1800_Transcript_1_1_Confidence_1.000_Length_641::g.5451::m.5451